MYDRSPDALALPLTVLRRLDCVLATLPDTLHRNREAFLKDLKAAEKKTGTELSAPLRKAVLSALSERDEEADICRDKDGHPEPDPDLRDYENVPLGESITDYFAREVRKVERQIVRMLADVTGSQPGGTAA
jgi:hypothetical protein